MKFKMYLFAILILTTFSVNAELTSKSDLSPESDFYQVNKIKYSFHNQNNNEEYISNQTRIWYSFFPAENDALKKPLFVLLNGGPGCGTSTNLFAMNTAPYSLDKNRVKPGELSIRNKFRWTKLGNILYIDAPNAGFSYMLSDTVTQAGAALEFVSGNNFNPFIDADQVLRTVLHFLAAHSQIQKNKVIFVGESYSGVRVSTILNLILFYSQYENGEKVFKDTELSKLIEKHLNKALVQKSKKPYPPEDIAKIFGKQILIQPQIVDSFQSEDKCKALMENDSIMTKLEKETKATESWKDFCKKHKDVDTAATLYLRYIVKRDQYNYLQPWDWTDKLEESSVLALNDIDELSKITETNIRSIKYLKPEERENSLRYMFKISNLDILQKDIIKEIIGVLNPQARLFIELFPFSSMYPPDMQKNGKILRQVLGGLTEYDNYVIGTNVYVFIGFMTNAGIKYNFEDVFNISPGSSTIYGKMFLENLSVVDTFMTNAAYDLVVYSPALPYQFDNTQGRFGNIVSSLEVFDNDVKGDGFFTIHYKKNSIKGLKNTPKSRTVTWPYYKTSGHSVSTTQPEKLLIDIAKWVNK